LVLHSTLPNYHWPARRVNALNRVESKCLKHWLNGHFCASNGFFPGSPSEKESAFTSGRADILKMALAKEVVTIAFGVFAGLLGSLALTHFHKNLAVMGGLLVLAYTGPGKWAPGKATGKPEIPSRVSERVLLRLAVVFGLDVQPAFGFLGHQVGANKGI
jgi:hypothetical protein